MHDTKCSKTSHACTLQVVCDEGLQWQALHLLRYTAQQCMRTALSDHSLNIESHKRFRPSYTDYCTPVKRLRLDIQEQEDISSIDQHVTFGVKQVPHWLACLHLVLMQNDG